MTEYIAYIIQGMLTGFGSAIGTYFAFKYGIDHIERIPLVKDKIKEYVTTKNPTEEKKEWTEDKETYKKQY